MVMTARAVVSLCLCLSVCQIRGSHISVEMNRTIQNLLQHYKVSHRQLFNGEPVFKEPQGDRTEGKKVFMLGVLDTYEKLLGQMLKELPTPSTQTNESIETGVLPTPGTARGDTRRAVGGDVRAELNSLLRRIQKLRRNHYQEQEKLLQGLQALGKIQMHDRLVQSKALFELSRLYEEASSLTNDTVTQNRRRRRQTRRMKTRPRA